MAVPSSLVPGAKCASLFSATPSESSTASCASPPSSDTTEISSGSEDATFGPRERGKTKRNANHEISKFACFQSEVAGDSAVSSSFRPTSPRTTPRNQQELLSQIQERHSDSFSIAAARITELSLGCDPTDAFLLFQIVFVALGLALNKSAPEFMARLEANPSYLLGTEALLSLITMMCGGTLFRSSKRTVLLTGMLLALFNSILLSTQPPQAAVDVLRDDHNSSTTPPGGLLSPTLMALFCLPPYVGFVCHLVLRTLAARCISFLGLSPINTENEDQRQKNDAKKDEITKSLPYLLFQWLLTNESDMLVTCSLVALSALLCGILSSQFLIPGSWGILLFSVTAFIAGAGSVFWVLALSELYREMGQGVRDLQDLKEKFRKVVSGPSQPEVTAARDTAGTPDDRGISGSNFLNKSTRKSVSDMDILFWPYLWPKFLRTLIGAWVAVGLGFTLIECVNHATVFFYGLLTCLCTGLGIVPFLVGPRLFGSWWPTEFSGDVAVNMPKRRISQGTDEISQDKERDVACTSSSVAGAADCDAGNGAHQQLAGAANSIAAGTMVAASLGLLQESADASESAFYLEVLIGFIVGGLFVQLSQHLLHSHDKDPSDILQTMDIEMKDVTKILLFVTVMFVHSIAEGVACGVSFESSDSFGLYVTLALSLHNIPEGLAIALVLLPRGFSKPMTTAIAILSSAPQPLTAALAVASVETFSALLPYALAFAAGAMVYVSMFEVGAEALEQFGKKKFTIASTLSFIGMYCVQIMLHGLTR